MFAAFPRTARRCAATWLAVTAAAAFGACIGTSPEEQLRADQGRAEDGDEEHRPGQPCLVCHGENYSPGGPQFAVAGTVYRYPDDPDDRGLLGATVRITDSDGFEFEVVTNRAGNFMVDVSGDVDAPRDRGKGRVRIPFEPAFPLSVAVVYGGEETAMESLVWREGSCAGCHRTSEPGTDHVERVWFEERQP